MALLQNQQFEMFTMSKHKANQNHLTWITPVLQSFLLGNKPVQLTENYKLQRKLVKNCDIKRT